MRRFDFTDRPTLLTAAIVTSNLFLAFSKSLPTSLIYVPIQSTRDNPSAAPSSSAPVGCTEANVLVLSTLPVLRFLTFSNVFLRVVNGIL